MFVGNCPFNMMGINCVPLYFGPSGLRALSRFMNLFSLWFIHFYFIHQLQIFYSGFISSISIVLCSLKAQWSIWLLKNIVYCLLWMHPVRHQKSSNICRIAELNENTNYKHQKYGKNLLKSTLESQKTYFPNKHQADL